MYSIIEKKEKKIVKFLDLAQTAVLADDRLKQISEGVQSSNLPENCGSWTLGSVVLDDDESALGAADAAEWIC